MARRTSLIEDIFDTLRRLPWWMGVITAAVFWFLGVMFTSGAAKDPMQNALRPLFKFLFNGLAILSLVAAVVSALQSLFRRNMLNRQTGIDTLRVLTWREFEQVVGETYARKGYSVEETGGHGADGGVDLILRGNAETVYVQCKQWRARQVGVDKVRELFGVITAESANRGVLVTSGTFTNDAKAFAAGKPITLVDGAILAQFVRAVQPSSPAAIPPRPTRLGASPSDACPRCGSPMVLRTAKRGASAGSAFYGCTKYPSCKGTRPAD